MLGNIFYPGTSLVGMVGAFWEMFLVLMVIGCIVAYVYFALVLSTIAKKLKHKEIAWLAWVPIAQAFLIPILAKKGWYWGFMFLVPIAGIVFWVIWTWNIFEQRKYPGWLSLVGLLGFIPMVGWLAMVANAVVWGLVAWRDQK